MRFIEGTFSTYYVQGLTGRTWSEMNVDGLTLEAAFRLKFKLEAAPAHSQYQIIKVTTQTTVVR